MQNIFKKKKILPWTIRSFRRPSFWYCDPGGHFWTLQILIFEYSKKFFNTKNRGRTHQGEISTMIVIALTKRHANALDSCHVAIEQLLSEFHNKRMLILDHRSGSSLGLASRVRLRLGHVRARREAIVAQRPDYSGCHLCDVNSKQKKKFLRVLLRNLFLRKNNDVI